jgi:Uncharacterised protein family (UPF0153).
MAGSELNQLCLSCGLCCNGVIFARGQLQKQDDPVRLKELGLKLFRPGSRPDAVKFRQPCAVLEGCRCTIYADRPQYCRQFRCSLFSRVEEGNETTESAELTVKRALRKVAKVRRLLLQMGDGRDDLPLATRFRRVQRNVESGGCSTEEAVQFGELTLAMHGLNLFLAENFYPG